MHVVSGPCSEDHDAPPLTLKLIVRLDALFLGKEHTSAGARHRAMQENTITSMEGV